MIRNSNVKYVFNCGDLDELYDLAADPHELRNLIHDKGSAKLLEEMRQSLADWMERHEDGLLRQFVRLKME
ncbi:sulfatase/phosphatase domain-containing protein [Paenibacillus cymbidii]|uniref:sulfatase/phosphatase domain-containing protein n=1 Tax=Paenibacillus cymbidii TaxID=1639034 RepID=UPI001081F5EC|nr:sulfatase/phosphatase domain-containing protein [Paenibacillus cymbidii]